MNTHRFALVFTIAANAAAAPQALSVDASAQISAEVKRVEAAWNAWRSSSNPKLEQTILTNPRALADVARDEQGAIQYLDARRRLFEKMAGAFALQIAALRAAEPQWNPASVTQVERQKLAELLATEERLMALPKVSEVDPARETLIREQQERDLNSSGELKRIIRHRIEILEALAGDQRSSRKQLDSLTANLEQVRRYFQDLANSTETERAEWQDYFDGLRKVVAHAGVPQQGKARNGNPDPSSPAKPRRER